MIAPVCPSARRPGARAGAAAWRLAEPGRSRDEPRPPERRRWAYLCRGAGQGTVVVAEACEPS
jgi:hypothetical protein